MENQELLEQLSACFGVRKDLSEEEILKELTEKVFKSEKNDWYEKLISNGIPHITHRFPQKESVFWKSIREFKMKR
ncbi:MAG TPA: hypothetical protein PK765_05320 [bacterium]|nr:hypothetical protein [bacterium]